MYIYPIEMYIYTIYTYILENICTLGMLPLSGMRFSDGAKRAWLSRYSGNGQELTINICKKVLWV